MQDFIRLQSRLNACEAERRYSLSSGIHRRRSPDDRLRLRLQRSGKAKALVQTMKSREDLSAELVEKF